MGIVEFNYSSIPIFYDFRRFLYLTMGESCEILICAICHFWDSNRLLLGNVNKWRSLIFYDKNIVQNIIVFIILSTIFFRTFVRFSSNILHKASLFSCTTHVPIFVILCEIIIIYVKMIFLKKASNINALRAFY